MTAALDSFIAEAKAVSLDVALDLVGASVKGSGAEKVGPCPVCGGRDRFSVNVKKGLWFCRAADRGGDALALIAYCSGYDLARRSGLVAACAEILGRPAPDGSPSESDDEKADRERRQAEAARKRERDRARIEAEQSAFRKREIDQARGIYFAAGEIRGTAGEVYLTERAGMIGGLPECVAESIRFAPALTLWHGDDETGRPRSVHVGPAIVAPFVDDSGVVVGCHQTWIDLLRAPKFRAIIDVDGEIVPAKKMRGSKKGSLIPVSGDHAAARWVIGEGIETVLAVAAAEGFDASTFYAAAGDIGQIAGPADPKSAFSHPTIAKPDKAGRLKPVRIQGPAPAADVDRAAFLPGAHVDRVVILADGDSELLFTASAMARTVARLSRPGLAVETIWPPEGMDFADVAVAARKTQREVA